MQTKSLQTKRVLRVALIVLLLCAVGTANALAQSFTVGDLNYSVNFDGTSVTVTGHVDGSSATGSLVIPETVEYNGSTYSVTSIGGSAFGGCSGFTGSLTIGNSVTSIGYAAFGGCSGFTGSLTIGNSVTTIGYSAFSGCSGFTGDLTIPNSVTTIDWDAFRGCSGFTGSLTIPNSVTKISERAFLGCSGFSEVHYNATNCAGFSTYYDYYDVTPYPFSGCGGTLIIGDNVEIIPKNMFRDGAFTGELTIGNSVSTICEGAFANCKGFTGELVIPNSVKIIEGRTDSDWHNRSAFQDCTGFTGLSFIGNSITKIGTYAFHGCSSLITVIIPNTVNSIGKNAFSNTAWYAAQPAGSILYLNNWCLGYKAPQPTGSFAFHGDTRGIVEEAFIGCNELTSIFIPNTVVAIGNNAFKNCSGLKEINFNAKDCIYDIWSGCSEVTTIVLGDFVESVKANMFSNFENLTTVAIGKSVKFIEGMAFANNPRLNMIYYNVEKDLEAATNVFYNCPNLTTIHIGPEVQEIGSNIFKGCNTVHFVVALGPTPAVLDAGVFSDIVDNSVLMVSCGKRVTYYSVWNMFPFNNIIEDCDTYGINVGAVGSGGTITPSVTEAQMGQEVQITITPNPSMALVSIKVVNTNDPTQIIPISPAGKAASTYSFTMPPFEVVVMATFKNSGASVGENNSVEVAVYPNPTNGLVKIEAESIKHVSISNMLGQVVFNGKVGCDAFEYDFSGQKAGIYFVRIETASGVVVKKVSVTR